MSIKSSYLAYDFRGEKLPSILPLFPVDGVALFPKNQLPLPILSAEHFATLSSVLYTHRLIGVVQPLEGKKDSLFFSFGTAGKILDIQQTDEGHLYATVLGVCRFDIKEIFEEKSTENESNETLISEESAPSLSLLERVFREKLPAPDKENTQWRARVDYTPFEHDLAVDVDFSVNRAMLLKEARDYLKRLHISAFLNEVDDVSDDYLVTTLATICPFSISEKQALLKASTLSIQAKMIIDFFKMSHHSNDLNHIIYH